MSMVRDDLHYTKEHEWVKSDGKNDYVGITDFAQHELGEIVYVEFTKETGDEIEAHDEFASVESTKSTSQVFTPVSGKIAAYNTKLEDNSELINNSSYDDGWIIKIEMSNVTELNGLMSASQYKEYLETLN